MTYKILDSYTEIDEASSKEYQVYIVGDLTLDKRYWIAYPSEDTKTPDELHTLIEDAIRLHKASR